jgi:exodeoxyribonuclease V gamma subunit
MLHLYTSNVLESLAERLGGIITAPPAGPFESETVVLQSLGMRRWLSLELASRLGVCANIDFPFPQTFLHQLGVRVLGEEKADAGFERGALTWRIMRLLPGLLGGSEFAELARYLEGERPWLKRFQLASKIADVFDRYLAFRPEMILEWDRSGAHWQALLWRAITAEMRGLHPPALGRALAAALPGAPAESLPRRLSVFGVSTLPPFHLSLLAELAARIDVHLFVLEPTPEWWGDIESEREVRRARRKGRSAAVTVDRGNPLLASFGRTGRDFLHVLFELNPAQHDDGFAEPSQGGMLASLQADLFHVREPVRRALPAADGSIQFHSCHSLMRELEVLHDQLLAMFENDATLLPKDVLVMLPDIAAASSFIEAVFDTPEQERTRIPFTIADRGARCGSGLIDTFLRILELGETRLPVSRVLAVLEDASVRRRFGLSEGDLEIIGRWVRDAAIRWGLDAAHREECGVPAFEQNSWRAGLDRLLLGYAFADEECELFEGILPLEGVEGGASEIAGALAEFMDRLATTLRDLKTARPLPAWQATLRHLLQRFFDPNEAAEYDTLQLRRAIEELGGLGQLAQFDEPVPLEVIRAHLAGAIETGERGAGFLAGCVTFCALKPMRSIPFKVICLLGMNDTAFPRHAPALGFDLMAQEPRRGDRTLRDDDRHLFLETLLSARDTLYLSFTGQSARDNSALPPSVAVSELLDYLSGAFEPPPQVVKHPLQPFSTRYFCGESLFSFSEENARAAAASIAARSGPPPFLSAPLPEPGPGWRTVTIRQLTRFFRGPVEYLLRERLGIMLPREHDLLEDEEPFEIDALERHRLTEALAEQGLAGKPPGDFLPIARAGGRLPPGPAGDALFYDAQRTAAEFVKVAAKWTAGGQATATEIDLKIGEWRILGMIDGIRGAQLVRARCATLKPKDLIAAWIPHLLLNMERPIETIVIGSDKAMTIHAPEAVEERLLALLELYATGLREPLKFFPETSYEFAQRTLAGNAGRDWRKAAVSKWKSFNGNGEWSQPAHQIAFRHLDDPLDDEWARIALEIFSPLLASARDCQPANFPL